MTDERCSPLRLQVASLVVSRQSLRHASVPLPFTQGRLREEQAPPLRLQKLCRVDNKTGRRGRRPLRLQKLIFVANRFVIYYSIFKLIKINVKLYFFIFNLRLDKKYVGVIIILPRFFKGGIFT